MTGHVTLPTWVLVVLVLLALLGAVDRLLLPGARWFLRRRVNIVLEEIGKRLHLEIRPFTLTKRQVLVDRLVYDPKVLESVAEHAREKGVPREAVMSDVRKYAREIDPAFNADHVSIPVLAGQCGAHEVTVKERHPHLQTVRHRRAILVHQEVVDHLGFLSL